MFNNEVIKGVLELDLLSANLWYKADLFIIRLYPPDALELSIYETWSINDMSLCFLILSSILSIYDIVLLNLT